MSDAPPGAATADWELLASTSHYHTAAAIRETWQQQVDGEATHGLEEFIAAWVRADQRALERHLIRVMPHVTTWKMPPERRSRSWIRTIHNGRQGIRKLQQDTSSQTDQLIREQLWDDCLDSAMGKGEGDMDCDLPALTLTWQEVLENEYRLD